MAQVDWVEYTTRESRRARRVILKISMSRGLEVVIPEGFDRGRLPSVLDSKKKWIERTLKRMADTRSRLSPRKIDLQAIGREWQVSYRKGSEAGLTAQEIDDRMVRVQGDTADAYGVAAALRRWLHLKARAHLTPWLHDVSEETGISFKKTVIRGQKTRWASCSRLQTISLNRSLLFLPEYLARHIFLHELCHIRRLDHSTAFWSALGSLEPDYKKMEAQVKEADRFVPAWAHPQ
jgi:predicted metal-dependent hydrolase